MCSSILGFKLQSGYYDLFRNDTFGKVMDPFILRAME